MNALTYLLTEMSISSPEPHGRPYLTLRWEWIKSILRFPRCFQGYAFVQKAYLGSCHWHSNKRSHGGRKPDKAVRAGYVPKRRSHFADPDQKELCKNPNSGHPLLADARCFLLVPAGVTSRVFRGSVRLSEPPPSHKIYIFKGLGYSKGGIIYEGKIQ